MRDERSFRVTAREFGVVSSVLHRPWIENPCSSASRSIYVKKPRVLESQKLLHPLQRFIQRPLKCAAAWPLTGEAQLVLQPSIDHLQIGPTQHLLSPQHGHCVMSHATLMSWHVGLQLVFPAPQQLEAPAVPDHGVEGRKEA